MSDFSLPNCLSLYRKCVPQTVSGPQTIQICVNKRLLILMNHLTADSCTVISHKTSAKQNVSTNMKLETFSSPNELKSILKWLKSQNDMTTIELEYSVTLKLSDRFEQITIWRYNSALIISRYIVGAAYYRVNAYSSTKDDLSTLLMLLKEKNCLPTHVHHQFRAVNSIFTPMMCDILQLFGFKKVEVTERTWLMFLPEDAVIPNKPHPTYAIRPLKCSEAEMVNSHSAHVYAGTLEVIRVMIKDREAWCVVNEKDEPICWCIQREYGEKGNLYCLERYRGQGHAQRASGALSAAIRKKGEAVRNYSSIGNTAANKFALKSIGAKIHSGADWIACRPIHGDPEKV